MTISLLHIIKEMLENRGVYMTDPAVAKIYKYNHANGQTLHACFYPDEYDDTTSSAHVTNPILLMQEGEITDAGKEYLATLQNA